MKKYYLLIIVFIVMVSMFVLSGNDAVVKHKSIKIKDCSIMQEICYVKLTDALGLSLDISPKGMPPTKTATAIVRLDNINANEIKIKFESVGSNYQPLTIVLDKIDSKTYNGRAFLSLCTLEKTEWLAHLTVHTDDIIWKISFPFVHSGDGYNITSPSF